MPIHFHNFKDMNQQLITHHLPLITNKLCNLP